MCTFDDQNLTGFICFLIARCDFSVIKFPNITLFNTVFFHLFKTSYCLPSDPGKYCIIVNYVVFEAINKPSKSFQLWLWKCFQGHLYGLHISCLWNLHELYVRITLSRKTSLITMKYEPQHDKTNKIKSAPNEDSVQPGHSGQSLRCVFNG